MKIFREESLTKVNSPEQLNEYMKVTSTPVWIKLAAVIFLLLGICMWAMMEQVETTITVEAQGHTYRSHCEVDIAILDDIKIGTEIICDGQQGTVEELIELEDRVQVISYFQEVLPETMSCDITSSSSWLSLLMPYGNAL